MTYCKKNGNSIFLPAAGYGLRSDFFSAGSDGYYWSSAVGLPIPTIESVQGGTKVCFKRPTNVGSLSEDVGSLESVKLTDRQKNICKMLIINPHASAKAMSEVLSVVPRTIERELSSLQKAGVIRHEGKTSGGKWVVLIAQF